MEGLRGPLQVGELGKGASRHAAGMLINALGMLRCAWAFVWAAKLIAQRCFPVSMSFVIWPVVGKLMFLARWLVQGLVIALFASVGDL